MIVKLKLAEQDYFNEFESSVNSYDSQTSWFSLASGLSFESSVNSYDSQTN